MNFKSNCLHCRHFNFLEPDDEEQAPSCAAFPLGIPDEIIRQGFDHRHEYPGDDGIRFELDDDGDPSVVDRLGGGVS